MMSAWYWLTVTVGGFLLGIASYYVGKAIKHSRRADQLDAETDATSEFACEVVRITSITPIVGSNRLDQATFEMRGTGPSAYQVVVGRGDFTVGDLAVYISVDAMVPLTDPAFSFLAKRLDAKRYWPLYRLKAARFLKTVFSQGLLIPVPSELLLQYGHYGQRMAQHLGVTKYVSPEEQRASYCKGTGSKRKSNAGPSPVYGVTSLKKAPTIFEEGEWVHGTEEVHGSNIRFGWVPRKVFGIQVGWRFFVGSHRVEKVDGEEGGYYKEDVWNAYAKANRLADRTQHLKGLVFYGELFGEGIQDLTYGRDEHDLVVFDILRLSGQEWLSLEERTNLLDELSIKQPPEVGFFKWSQDLPWAFKDGFSALHAGTVREGVVFEALSGERRKAKFVSQAYLLRDQ